ncbi:class I SAM-dependent methyltransferase [Candidatus Obscuribacterales bacterium]|nr:class I SAM-dependent methyltransferase [Candidatus Obscuribacterales bacterium]
MPGRITDIESYLTEAGLKPHRNTNQFWSYLDTRYSKSQVSELESSYVKLEQGDENGFYQDIFQSPAISTDFSSLRWDLYRSYLSWFTSITNTFDEPKQIVDVGCGNGILTCFYAKRFPNAKVLGFDISENGVACAKELSKLLGVSNAEFVVGDSFDLSLPIEKGSADLILSVASLGPSASEADSDVSAYDLLTTKPKLKEMIQLTNLVPYLEPTRGLFISFDKVSNLAMQVTWANIIQRCGLGVDLSRSSWITYQNIESDSITLPVIVAGPHLKASSADDIMSFLVTHETDFSKWMLDFGKESLAEAVFTFINPKEFLRGARASYKDGSGTYWYELWQAGPFAVVFEHTDKGFRTLRVSPSTKRDELQQGVDEWMEQTSSYADVVELKAPEIQFGNGNSRG